MNRTIMLQRFLISPHLVGMEDRFSDDLRGEEPLVSVGQRVLSEVLRTLHSTQHTYVYAFNNRSNRRESSRQLLSIS